jgi:stage V sporulation protein R
MAIATTSRRFPTHLKLLKYEIEEHARNYGLDFFDVIFEVLDYDEMNEVAAYGGFPSRYPHWRFGMEYEELSKGYSYGLQKIYEMVINNDPCYAYLLRSNNIVDQKIVMAHVYAHCDFFKNNIWFSKTNRKMVDEMANHGTRVQNYIERHGEDAVEGFLDTCLSIEDLIDPHAPFIQRRRPVEQSALRGEEEAQTVQKMRSKEYMDGYINPREFIEAERKKIEEERAKAKQFPEEPERDVMLFLIENAPLENWQRDMLSMVREEAYYFAPQGQTKVMNEGWACVVGDSLVFTDRGLVKMRDIFEDRKSVVVSDGKDFRRIYDWARFEDRKTVKVRTKRGYEIEGSITHQLMMSDGTWKRMDDLVVGDSTAIGAGINIWPRDRVALNWSAGERLTLEEVSRKAGVHLSTVIRHHKGLFKSRSADVLDPLLAEYRMDLENKSFMANSRASIQAPEIVDERLASFLGYLLSDGNISECKRVVSLTTGDEEQADRFSALSEELFGIKPIKVKDDARWRIHLYSQNLIGFLGHLGCPTGYSARIKTVPEVILQSPKPVVAAFLSSYFDGDGYAGELGIILSTSSEELGKVVQLILLNFGILSNRRPQKDGCWHVHIFGRSAKTFLEEIGFGLKRKQDALRRYVHDRRWFNRQDLEDKIVSVERGRADVYDVSVEGTHRYAAHGFINHNSYWHSKIMTTKMLDPSEVIDYADHHAGTLGVRPGRINPYKLGIELFRDIEERWDKGKFGPEYDACDDLDEKRRWDRQLGLGRQKIFEVRSIYNDVGFIDTFLTEEFCRDHHMFTYRYNEQTNRYEIEGREFEKIKQKLLFSLTNHGRPFIYVVEGNHRNRGELYLSHKHEGVDLRMDYAKDTLANLYKLWGRPVHLETISNDRGVVLSFDGTEHTAKARGGA